jgi:hypothetical protein
MMLFMTFCGAQMMFPHFDEQHPAWFARSPAEARTRVASASQRRRSEPGAAMARFNSPASSHTRSQAGQVSITMLPGP